MSAPFAWKRVAAESFRDTYHVEAPAIGDTLEITVVRPRPDAASSGRRFPTIYLLDAWVTLDVVVGTLRLYNIFSNGNVPQAYIVGISYADPDVGARRFRDFTHTDAALPAELVHSTEFGLGGAGRYLSFLRDEIIPHLEEQYPLEARQRVLAGYSLSGLCVTYALFQQPEYFERYLIISPSLWWDNASILNVEEQWARTQSDLAAKVLLTVGECEESPGAGWRNNLPDEVGLPLKQVSRVRELSEKLLSRNYPGLRMSSLLIPEGRHITVFPSAVGLGLAELFAL